MSLVVANIGDSRAVISKNGAAIQLSIDHEPKREQQKIEEKGGFVSNFPGNLSRYIFFHVNLIFIYRKNVIPEFIFSFGKLK